jgi:excisionase family DNA binding protein
MSEFMTCKEAANVAACSELTIKRAVRAGDLTAYRPGRTYQIDKADLLDWIKSKRVGLKPKMSKG